MFVLAVVGVLAGIVTSLSPCVLPVLPIVLAAGGPRRDPGLPEAGSSSVIDATRRSWRPYGVVAGLVLSFSVSTPFGSPVLSALHLPQDLLRTVGVVVLAVVGLSLLWPRVGELLERPFARTGPPRDQPGRRDPLREEILPAVRADEPVGLRSSGGLGRRPR